jgi:isopenicillin-N epimerase
MMRVDLSRWRPDFYASSPHKWLLAPQGTGLLYLDEAWRTRLWPTLASGGWDDPALGAHRLNHLGTFDESRMAGLLAAVEFLQALGMERVEARIRFLRNRLEAGLRTLPGVEVATPEAEPLKAGMVSFALDGVDSLELQRHLSRVANARTRVIGEYGYGWMRLSTHIYNRPDEVDRVLEILDAVARRGIPGA